jgi:CDP-diacylglycerol--glycerol-3-phosphate 3-phosphatidyltransferase
MNVIPQAVKDGFVRAVEPLARTLIRLGISPNAITTAGLFVVLAAAVAYGTGAVRVGGLIMLASGLFDVLDGQVARLGRRSTAFGAFYDSTLDRVGESALFGGLAMYFLNGGVPPHRVAAAVLVVMAALVASLLVSYTRARAEGLGLDCRVGIAPRAERVLVLGGGTLLFGAGPGGALLFWIVVALAVAAGVTVVQRVVHVARTAGGATPGAPPAKKRDTLPGHAPALRKGHGL